MKPMRVFHASRKIKVVFLSACLLGTVTALEAQTDTRIPQGAANYLGVTNGTANGSLDTYSVVFIEIPATETAALYLAVFDADMRFIDTAADPCDSASTHTAAVPAGAVTNPRTIFTLVGGSGALSHPVSRIIDYANPVVSPYNSAAGTLPICQWTNTDYARNSGSGQTWWYGPGTPQAFYAGQGELIGNKRYFKLIIEAATDGGWIKNGFQVDVSYAASGVPTGVTGGRSFAYSWNMNLINGNTWDIYPFVPDATGGSMYAWNWDVDGNATLNAYVQSGAGWAVGPGVSGNSTAKYADAGTGSQAIAGTEDNGSWRLHINATGAPPDGINTAEFWFTNNNVANSTLPFRAYSTQVPPQPAPDHVTAVFDDGTATADGVDTEPVTLQVVDASGSPVEYVQPIIISVNPAATARITSVNGTAMSVTSTTQNTTSTGTMYVTVSDTAEETVTFQAAWVWGTAGNTTLPIVFVANPRPTLTSATNAGFTLGAGATATPVITVTHPSNPALFAAGDTVYLDVPAGLDCVIDTANPPPTLGGSAFTGGRVNYLTGTFATSVQNGGKRLAVSVSADWNPGDTLTITGLRCMTFGSVSSGRLELNWTSGGNPYQSIDTAIYSITDPTLDYTWTGAASQNWDGVTTANWSPNGIPGAGSRVYIPGSAGLQPVLTGAVTVTDLTIGSSASVSTAGQNLTVSGTFANSGTLRIQAAETVTLTLDTDSGAVEYYGAGGGTVRAFGGTYHDLVVTGGGTWNLPAGIVSLNGTLTLTNGVLSANGQELRLLNETIDLNAAAGTLRPDGGTIRCQGFTQTAGAFNDNAVGGTLESAGDVSITGGTHTAGAYTLRMTGGGTTLETSAARNPSNLTIDTTAGDVTLNAALDMNGSLTITSGALDISAAEYQINVGGDWSNAVGDAGFIQRTGTVVLDEAGAGGILSAETFYNLTVSNGAKTCATGFTSQGTLTVSGGSLTCDTAGTVSAHTLTLSGGDFDSDRNVTVTTGDFTVTNALSAFTGAGAVDMQTGGLAVSAGSFGGTGNVTVAGNVAVSGAGTALSGDARTITLQGNWSVAATSVFDSGGGTVEFGGNNAQTLTPGGVDANHDFTDLTVNKTGNTLQLAADIDVNGSIDVQAGTLTDNARQINLAGDWTAAVGAVYTGTGTLVFDSGAAPAASTVDTGGNDVNHDLVNVRVADNTIVNFSSHDVSIATGLVLLGNNSVVSMTDRNFAITNLDFNGMAGRLELYGTQATQTITAKNNGVIRYTQGAGAGVILIPNIYNLEIAGGTQTQSLSADTVIGNDLTVYSGTLSPAGFTLETTRDLTVDGGTLTVGAVTVTVGRDFTLTTGTVNLNTGVLEVNEDFIHSAGTFNAGTGTVRFINNALVSQVLGDTTFYNFSCTTANKIIQFQTNSAQTVGAGGSFTITGADAANRVTLQNTTGNPGAAWADPTYAFDPAVHWRLTINASATASVDWTYVECGYATNPVFPDNTAYHPAFDWCYNWRTTLNVSASRTLDVDADGKIDRIEVEVEFNTSLDDDFSALTVAVTGYAGSITFSTYRDGVVPAEEHDDLFYIILDEGAQLNTGWTPVWRITVNNSLRANTGPTIYVGPTATDLTAADAAPPLIGYSLAAAGRSDVFIHVSETVYDTAAGTPLAPANFTYAGLNPVSIAAVSSREYLLTFAANPGVIPFTTADVVNGVNLTFTNVVDQADQGLVGGSPLNRPVSDIILAVPGREPVAYVMADLSPREPGPEGIGYITKFDGSEWVPFQAGLIITMAVQLVPPMAGTPEGLIWDADTTHRYQDMPLWYPDPDTPYAIARAYGLVPQYNITSEEIIAGAPDFTVDFSASPEFAVETLIEFYIRFDSGLAYGRLTRPQAGDWYRSVRPFAFGIHAPGGTQKGNVEIFKNVINPTLGDVTKIRYVLPRDGNVTIQVFNLAGDIVDVLYAGWLTAGEHSTAWDGRNRGTRIVARGLYFIKVVGPDIDETRKVLVVK